LVENSRGWPGGVGVVFPVGSAEEFAEEEPATAMKGPLPSDASDTIHRGR
jgi:hypothetical protein